MTRLPETEYVALPDDPSTALRSKPGSAEDNIHEARIRLQSARERLARQLDGRRPTLPPAAAPFAVASRILGTLQPRTDMKTCPHCTGPVKIGGVAIAGRLYHNVCATQVAGGVR